MNTQKITQNDISYLEVLPDDFQLASERDALDLVGECGSYEVDRLLLPNESLPDAFFDLRTRLAGDVMLKFSNYAIRVAAVIPAERVGSGKFYEMALETNRGKQFRIFPTHAAAEAWLLSL